MMLNLYKILRRSWNDLLISLGLRDDYLTQGRFDYAARYK